jgi:hypothetical protein
MVNMVNIDISVSRVGNQDLRFRVDPEHLQAFQTGSDRSGSRYKVVLVYLVYGTTVDP